VSAASHDSSMPSHAEIHLSDRSTGWKNAPLVFGGIGVVALGIAFAMKGEHSKEFYFSYLTALMFWLALGLGGLFFVAIGHAARAGWSIVVRRLAENLAITLPMLGLLALPVVFMGAHDLFHWTHTEAVLNDPMLRAKMAYLNEDAFRVRGIVTIVLWSGLALMYWRWSTTQDTSSDPIPLTHKMRWIAPLSLILFALTLTFGAAIDWLMSLDPHWFSTVFGVYYFAGCVVSVHAFLALAVIVLHRSGYLRGVVTPEHFHDLGKMMFAFTVFWAYIGFSQYMLIWYASIPEETHWYSYRGQGQWLTLSIVLVFARFVFPFLGLMSRKIKRNPKTLAFWAIWVLVAQFIDMFWLVHPVLANEHHEPNIHFGLADVTTWVGIGGLVLAVFTWACGRSALVPVKDPRLLESVNHENF
jgi:hypothetical protein